MILGKHFKTISAVYVFDLLAIFLLVKTGNGEIDNMHDFCLNKNPRSTNLQELHPATN